MDNIIVTTPPPIELSTEAAPVITITPASSSVSIVIETPAPVAVSVTPAPSLRILASSSELAYPQVVSAASQLEETAAFLAGAKIVIRTDLL